MNIEMKGALCMYSITTFRPFPQRFPSDSRNFFCLYRRRMDVSELPPKYIKACAFSGAKEGSPSSVSSISSSMPAYTDDSLEEDEEGIDAMAHESLGVNDITLEEWQAWGSSSQIPAMVRKTIDNLKLLEHELEIKMNFCGPRGKLQGKIRIEEDKKHRATYKGLSDSEQKLQFFTARQVACRLLGSRGYLCQNDHARAMWGEESLPCVALSHTNVSVMHRLRPQPSLDRTCTAAASIQLLSELNLIQELALHRLDQSAEALENSLGLLLDALSGRRQRMGRSIIRPQRWKGSK